MRVATVERNTRETQITGRIDLDGSGAAEIATGIGFLDHMLEQLAKHSLIDISLQAQGDLHIDFHHTTEDTGYVIGEAVSQALGARAGIQRYGHAMIPFDETLTRVASICRTGPIWSGGWRCRGQSSAIWIPSCSRSGFRPSRNRPA